MPKTKVNKLFRKVLWFRNRAKFDIDFFDILLPARTVSQHYRYKSGVYYSEKCGREIQYESALELEFIKKLEKHRNVMFYWDQPVRISYWRGRRRQTYTPDFGIYLRSREFIIAEVKDLPGMLDHRVQMKTEALMEFCSQRGFGLLLTDGKNSPDRLLKAKVNRKLEREILAALGSNVLRKTECQQIMGRCHATQSQLYKTIIRNDLKFRPFPLKLQRGNGNLIFRQVFFEKKSYDDLVEYQTPDWFKATG